MRLTEDDKKLLKSWGHPDRDMEQIEEAIRKTVYTIYRTDSGKGKRISAKAALEILGRRAFLSGISRSAFHYTALRKNDDHVEVHFNSKKLFE